jgi:hypothetical protein
MALDTSELDAACIADDIADEAIWLKSEGSVAIPVHFGIGNDYIDENGTKIQVDDKIVAGTLESQIVGMSRDAILSIKGKQYVVLAFEPDGSGWTEILLEAV